MPRVLQKSGFTLIETMVAIVIALTLLGASVAASRVVNQHTSRLEDQAQMNALADEALSYIQLVKTANQEVNGQGIGAYASIGGTTQVAVTCTNCRSGAGINFGSTSAIQPTVTLGGVAMGPSSTLDTSQASVRVDGNPPVFTTQMTDIYALPRDITNGFLNGQLSFDLSAPFPTSYSGGYPDTSTPTFWNMYKVLLTVSRPVLVFNSDATTAAANQAALQGRMYQVVVTVSNYHDPSSHLTKTLLITDW